ncbi:hypothetical protein WKH57_01155 [Niallia taxi]|uniref:hypothetical protein n=1 Tax=Niallia taxi TaxID=2499688 RepID=UPI0031772C4C
MTYKLEIGQTWISEDHPHESFMIYDGIIDTCVDSFEDESLPFNEQPETTKIFFWERINRQAFFNFVEGKKGVNYDTTYPYSWCGETKKQTIVNKIKKYGMKLSK